MSDNPKTIAQKQDELDALLAWFESDEFDIDQSIEQFEKASALADDIEKDLMTVQNKVTVLKQSFEKE